MAAIRKLRAKGQVLSKVDPNSVKRKRSDFDVPGIFERVEQNIADSEGAENPRCDDGYPFVCLFIGGP